MHMKKLFFSALAAAALGAVSTATLCAQAPTPPPLPTGVPVIIRNSENTTTAGRSPNDADHWTTDSGYVFPPGSDVIALWNSTSRAAQATGVAGTSLTFGGIRVAYGVNGVDSPDGNINFTTSFDTITLGQYGIVMEDANPGMGIKLSFSAGSTAAQGRKVVLSDSQTWYVGANQTLDLGRRQNSGDPQITLAADKTLTLSGRGTFLFNQATDPVNGALGVGKLIIENGVTLKTESTAQTYFQNSATIFKGDANFILGGWHRSNMQITNATLLANASGKPASHTFTLGTTQASANTSGYYGAVMFQYLKVVESDLTTPSRNASISVVNSDPTKPLAFYLHAPTNFGVNNISIGNGVALAWDSAAFVDNQAVVNVAAGGLVAMCTLDATTSAFLGGRDATFAGLTGAGKVAAEGTTGATLKLAGNDANARYVFNGDIAAGKSNLNLIKTGASTQVLNGTNSYKGTTNINEGTLIINGDSSAATGDVTVASNAALIVGKNGKVGGAVEVQGSATLGAGGTFADDVTIVAGGILNADGGTFSKGLTIGAGTVWNITSHEGITVEGLLLAQGTITLNYDLSAGTFEYHAGLSASECATLFDCTLSGFVTDDVAMKMDLDSLPEFLRNALDYDESSGRVYFKNYVFIPIPEPSTWLLLGLGAAFVALARRKSVTK